MSAVVAILVVLCAGLFVGSRVNGAREARSRYSSSRNRAVKGFSTWLHSLVSATFGVAGLAVLMFVLVFMVRMK